MYIDFTINSTDINDTEAKNIIATLNKYKINSITVPYHLIKAAKYASHNPETLISCFIDYPLGILDLKTRLCGIEQAKKNGANCIDICISQNLASNRKYDKIREDTKTIIDFGNQNELTIRYIIEYRVFDHNCLKKICEIFDENNIVYVFPSTGFFIDNLADNILACIFLHNNSKNLNIISTGNLWLDKHFETLIKSNIFGFRTTSIHSLDNYTKYNSITKN